MSYTCQDILELLTPYLEHELTAETQQEVQEHLRSCADCNALMETLATLLERLPELEEDVPFFLRNRLLNIPEQGTAPSRPAWALPFMGKWAAALIGTVLLFLNLFYFTDIYPAANRTIHAAVSRVERLVSRTGGLVEKVRESKNLLLFTFFNKGTMTVKEIPAEQPRLPDPVAEQGGKNG